MAFLFGSSGGAGATPAAQMREVNRGLRRNTREMDREVRKLQVEEKKAMAEVKKLSNAGQSGAAKMMAKNVVQLRKQQEKMIKTKAQLSGVQNMTKTAQASQAMMKGMSAATQALAQQNAMMNPQQMQQMAMQFERESTKMEMMQEMMEDTMESVLGGSEDEEEADELTQSIFDELNIEAFSKAGAIPTAQPKSAEPAEEEGDYDNMVARLARLREAS